MKAIYKVMMVVMAGAAIAQAQIKEYTIEELEEKGFSLEGQITPLP